MAQQYRCDVCEAVLGDLMITMIATGDTMSVCLGCLPAFAETVTGAVDRAAAEVPPEAVGSSAASDALAAADQWAASVAADGLQEPADGPEGEWEAGYPQGRQEGPPEGRGGPAEDGREGAEAEAAPNVAG